MSNKPSSLCDEVANDLARVIDGTAAPELYDHIAGCDACRDMRHEASRLVGVVRSAGADFSLPAGFGERLDAAIDARPGAVSARDDAPAPRAPSTESKASGEERKASEAPVSGGLASRLPDEQWAALTGKGSSDSAEGDGDEPRDRQPAAGPAVVRQFPRRLVWAVPAVLAAAAGYAVLARSGAVPDVSPLASSWSGEVTTIARAGASDEGGVELCDASGSGCAPASVGQRFEAGKRIRTGPRARAQLRMADGSTLELDRSTDLSVDSRGRAGKLHAGALLCDIAHRDGDRASLAMPGGSLEVLGTRFLVKADEGRSRVTVSRGRVRLTDSGGASEVVYAGEEGRVGQGSRLAVAPTAQLAEGFSWAQSSFRTERDKGPKTDTAEPLRGLGELRARKPGQTDERDQAVRLARHSARVRIVDNVARTEIEEVFQNDAGDELEGIYRFPLPPDAQIARLALEVNGKLEEGAFVEKEKASAIWRGVIQNAAPKAPKPVEEIIWVPGPWRDPALLEWKRGGRFELRIFPIPARGSRRLILAYTQPVPLSGTTRKYTYPLPYDPKGSTTVESFTFDAQVLGHDKAVGVASSGYKLSKSQGDSGGDKLALNEQRFVPSGDLSIEYALPGDAAEVSTWAYQPPSSSGGDDGSPYAVLALRPKLPRRSEGEARDRVVVVDSSRSMVGERFARARAVVGALVRDMDEGDRVTVMACDVRCQPWGSGLVEAGAQAAEGATRFLSGIVPDGSSDLSLMVKSAREATRQGERAVDIVYVGDGGASAGPVKPDHLTAEVRRLLPSGKARVMAIAVGSDADVPLLSAMTRGGGGVVMPFVPGQSADDAAMSALGAMYGATLERPELTLPAGLVSVAPTQLDSIRAGGEALVVARMTSAQIEGEAVLKGTVAGKPFEQRYPLKVVASREAGNAFVPRLYAATRIADLERAGGDASKQAIVDLSKRFAVASRHTSLLVLESEAMMNAFGLKRANAAPAWTGESQAEHGEADGSTPVADPVAAASAGVGSMPSGGPGASGMGFGGGGRLARPSATSFASPPSIRSPGFDEPAPPPAPAKEEAKKKADIAGDFDDGARASRRRPPPRDMPPRRMIPMKRVWDRKGTFFADAVAFHDREAAKIISAEGALSAKPDSRNLTQSLFGLYAQHGRLDRASELAERWASRDALDPSALVARADLAARTGDRDGAIRILSGIVDVRPDDAAAQRRLAGLFEQSGQPERACAHRTTLAELAPDDAQAQIDALRCTRNLGQTELADRLSADITSKSRGTVDKGLEKAAQGSGLTGDVRLEATWDGDADLDLALIDKNGARLSWMGAGKTQVSSRDVTGSRGEGVAFTNLGAGSYVLEVVRSKHGDGKVVSGTITVRAVGETRQVPFTLSGERLELGRVEVSYTSRLVPVDAPVITSSGF